MSYEDVETLGKCSAKSATAMFEVVRHHKQANNAIRDCPGRCPFLRPTPVSVCNPSQVLLGLYFTH